MPSVSTVIKNFPAITFNKLRHTGTGGQTREVSMILNGELDSDWLIVIPILEIMKDGDYGVNPEGKKVMTLIGRDTYIREMGLFQDKINKDMDKFKNDINTTMNNFKTEINNNFNNFKNQVNSSINNLTSQFNAFKTSVNNSLQQMKNWVESRVNGIISTCQQYTRDYHFQNDPIGTIKAVMAYSWAQIPDHFKNGNWKFCDGSYVCSGTINHPGNFYDCEWVVSGKTNQASQTNTPIPDMRSDGVFIGGGKSTSSSGELINRLYQWCIPEITGRFYHDTNANGFAPAGCFKYFNGGSRGLRDNDAWTSGGIEISLKNLTEYKNNINTFLSPSRYKAFYFIRIK